MIILSVGPMSKKKNLKEKFLKKKDILKYSLSIMN
jgi:hypothetical protein